MQLGSSYFVDGAKRFGTELGHLTLLGGFSNHVFAAHNDNHSFILKFYHSDHYKLSSIYAELDWIQYLFASGVSVTRPLRSLSGKYIEIIDGDKGETCAVLAFEKSDGIPIHISNAQLWNPKLFRIWGQTLGKIHYLSKSYEPAESIQKQYWNEGSLFNQSLDDLDEQILHRWEAYVEQLSQLPRTRHTYGMIHNDLHVGNFHTDSKIEQLILFDFGDCEYGWFIYDIAICLYHAVQSVSELENGQREQFASMFLQHFLEGYQLENELEPQWRQSLTFFLHYRRIFSYIYFCKFLTKDQKSNPNIILILENMKTNIQQDKPFLQLF